MRSAGQLRPAHFLYHTFWCAVDWFFLPTCGGCGKPGERWCAGCQQGLERISGPICPRCGDPQPAGRLCHNCLANPPAFDTLRSFAIFGGPVREALHHLKYKRDIGLGEALSKHLIELYNQLQWDVDVVTPVPLSTQRMKERGYNQAAILGRPLAYAIGKPCRALLRKSRDTRTQVGLNAVKRQENVTGAFTTVSDRLAGKSILVIDDVTTTGSTINACSQALRQAGAAAVYGLTLARATLQTHADPQPTHIS
jgi:ComF family protein